MQPKIIKLDTQSKRKIVDITDSVNEFIKESDVQEGIAVIHVMHTTAAIVINENEKGLFEDFDKVLEKIIPENAPYEHDNFEERNCPECERINGAAHIQSMFLGVSKTIPIENNKLSLGKWQRVLFVELDGPRTDRKIQIKLIEG